MAEHDLRTLLSQIQPGDIRIDEAGRVVINRPDIADRLKRLKDLAGPVARDDTNIICCGNDSCAKSDDLGAIAERLSKGAGRNA